MSSLQRLEADQNAYVFRFDPALLDEIRASWSDDLQAAFEGPQRERLLGGGQRIWERCAGSQGRYHLASFNTYPLLWASCADQATYALFERFLQATGMCEPIAKRVDHDQRLIMYCGFLVVGDRAPNPNWHTDYRLGAQGYTLITPLFELPSGHGHLLYLCQQQRIRRYRYQVGEAIVFGDGFMHSTQPFPRSPHVRVLLSLTVGTDRMQHWPTLKPTVGMQSALLRLPSGEWLHRDMAPDKSDLADEA